MTIAAVLFDIDGTLIDSNELHVRAWQQVFTETGHAISDEAIRRQIGKGGDKLVPTLLPDAPTAEQKALAKGQGRLFKQLFIAHAEPFPQARALLDRVHADGRRIVLASSASEEELRHYVDLLDIAKMIHATTSIDDVRASKPAADIFSIAIERAGVAPAAALAVGDTIYDVEAAQKAGVATVGLLSGPFDQPELEAAGAIAVYRDVADLLEHYDSSPLAR